MTTRLAEQTVVELSEGLARGEFRSKDIVEDVLAAIREKDGRIRAYLHVDAERAIRDAEAADRARDGGDARPLLGIPVAVKDVLNVEGDPCTCASRILEGYTAPYTATALARLRDAGALLVGRTNMDEFAMGSSTENSAYAATRNPWNTDCVPGGSSGGSAAAVAAGEAVAALGTDTGGSIRQPAAFCGIVGLKPSYGRVSRYGLTAYASSLDQIGPMTRSVADAALLLGPMAGRDPKDSTSVDRPAPEYAAALTDSLKGRVVGVPREYFAEGLDSEVGDAVEAGLGVLRDAGAEMKEVSMPHTRYAVAVYYIIATAEASANLARFDGVRYGARVKADDPIAMTTNTRSESFGTEVKRRIILGTYALSSGYYDAYYLRAQKVRTLIRRDYEEAFRACDALVAPTSPTPAFGLGERTADPLQMYLSDIYTVTANLAGVCGISVPCGFTRAGLPIGLQILGPAFGEDRILSAAHAYERRAGRPRAAPAPGKEDASAA